METLPPSLLVGEKLSGEAGLREPLSHDRHRTPIRHEEEERALAIRRRALKAQAEDPIGLHAQAEGLAAMVDFHLPAEGQA